MEFSGLTDILSGPELVEKTFVYITNLSKECRKTLTAQFQQKHKGLLFESIEVTMRQEIEAWFAQRDKNIRIRHEKSSIGRPGEILVTYSGSTKDAHFKVHIDSVFTTVGPGENAPSYLKNINVQVDKREFTR